jgi:hypothetical protein
MALSFAPKAASLPLAVAHALTVSLPELIARRLGRTDARVVVPLEQVGLANRARSGAQVAVADPLQRERLTGALAALQQNTQALAPIARALRQPLGRMGGDRPARRPAPGVAVPVLATLCDVVADGLHGESPVRQALPAMGRAVGLQAAAGPLFHPPGQAPGLAPAQPAGPR